MDQFLNKGHQALRNEVETCCIWMQAIWHHLLHIASHNSQHRAELHGNDDNQTRQKRDTVPLASHCRHLTDPLLSCDCGRRVLTGAMPSDVGVRKSVPQYM